MNTLNIKVGDRDLKGKVLKIKDTLWVHLEGETFVYRPESKAKQKAAHGIASNTVTAPMPGKIIKVTVNQGDKVEDGQVVVIMEAMKMEYSLRCSKSGRVKKITCKSGDQVQLGQMLLEIE